jgi:hypothetical protein
VAPVRSVIFQSATVVVAAPLAGTAVDRIVDRASVPVAQSAASVDDLMWWCSCCQ